MREKERLSIFFLTFLLFLLFSQGICLGGEKLEADTTFFYEWRKSEDFTDQDIYQYLNLSTKDIELGKGIYSFQTSLRIFRDIDGGKGTFFPADYYPYFINLRDLEGATDSIEARLYYAYLDIKDLVPKTAIRLGRQYDWTFEPLHFDGGKISFKPTDCWEIYGYAGTPVSFLLDVDENEEFITGAGIAHIPWRSLRLQADLLRIEVGELPDEALRDFYKGHDKSNNLFGLSFWWEIAPPLKFNGYIKWINNNPKDLKLEGKYYIKEIDTHLRASYSRVLSNLRAFYFLIAPFNYELLEYRKADRIDLSISRSFMQRASLTVGATFRSVKGGDTIGNVDMKRLYVRCDVYDLPFTSGDLSFNAGIVNTEQDNVADYDIRITRKVLKNVNIWGGILYSRYLYELPPNIFEEIVEKKEEVVRYYIGGEALITNNLSLTLDYSRERNDSYQSPFHVFQTYVSWKF